MQVFLLKSSDGIADGVAMSDSNGYEDLVGDLYSRLKGLPPRPRRVPDLPRRAVEAALADSTDERAWALVRASRQTSAPWASTVRP
jgi:hypothetical protein